MNARQLLLVLISAGSLSACLAETDAESPVEGRWYSDGQVARGEVLYQLHCAACHGGQAEGLADDWRKLDSNGNYPPPPLNGSAHAWHHPTEVLMQTIKEGGAALGGVMPPFEDVLEEAEMLATIAYFQSLWADDIYERWAEINDRE